MISWNHALSLYTAYKSWFDRAFCKFMIDDQNKLNTVFLFLLFPSAQLSAFLSIGSTHTVGFVCKIV